MEDRWVVVINSIKKTTASSVFVEWGVVKSEISKNGPSSALKLDLELG